MSREVRVSGIRRLLNLPASGRRIQREVDDEIRFHLESRVAELVAGGTPAAVARDIATREFGDVIEARAELTRVDQRRLTRERRQGWWETIGQDLAYSARSLRTQPGFAAIVVLVLALGIGANVTMFGVIDRLLLRAPEHVADPARLMSVSFGPIGSSRSAVGAATPEDRSRTARSTSPPCAWSAPGTAVCSASRTARSCTAPPASPRRPTTSGCRTDGSRYVTGGRKSPTPGPSGRVTGSFRPCSYLPRHDGVMMVTTARTTPRA